MERTIVRLNDAHKQAATATLTAAFMDDPAMCWMLRGDANRARRLPRLIAWMFDDHLRHGMVLGTPGCEVVTMWRPPGSVHDHAPLTPPALVRFVKILGRGVLRAERADRMIGHHLPKGEGQFYLRMAGVRPDRQGQGLGGLAIRAGLAEADAAHLPSVLETATQNNVGLYRSLGFDVIDTWRVARDGPVFWTMTRPAPFSQGHQG
ncbi:GNAT family N-acetyltransferase [Novosphingobium sp. SL115]|uniref:GNAT family N-acetyltransferase n=1 Tax=Novosphingobium sp. SL115 TaxID=2995150 RepID=UPI0022743B4C|nr:GNAT family N-acetyltransferase [Novosphingobium sp. SL115]MCY1671820.1 GNAT family N-acetyltransferase [Novosphingobium sp. SL115]